MAEEKRLYGAAAVAAGTGQRYTLKSDKVIKSWYQTIKDAAGKDLWFLQTVEDLIKKVSYEGMACRIAEVTMGGMFAEKRPFLVVAHNSLREYRMFIGARSIGSFLETSWFLTVNPSFLKRAISKKLTMGNPLTLSQNIDVFSQQNLSAMGSIASECVYDAVDMLLKQLNMDTSGLDRKGKGFLDLW